MVYKSELFYNLSFKIFYSSIACSYKKIIKVKIINIILIYKQAAFEPLLKVPDFF